MSREHAKVAKKIPGAVIRCGARRMLHYICEKCGSGVPFKTKGGKEITMPAGRYQLTDKEMMVVLGTNRRTTIRVNRKTMEDACKGAVTHTYEFKQGCRYPVIVYHVDLAKLSLLVPHSGAESARTSRTKGVQPIPKGCTESGAHTGVPSERIVGNTARSAVDVAVGGKVATPPSTQRSASLRIVGGNDIESTDKDNTNLYPKQDIDQIQESLNDLDGYEGKATPELATRVLKALEAHELLDWNYLNVLFDDYLLKAVWLRNKTEGRLDWLVDRLESKGERSALAQFKLFYAKRKHVEDSDAPSHWTCPGCDQTFASVHTTCPNGCKPKDCKFELEEVDMSDTPASKHYLEGPIDLSEDSELLKYLCDWCNKPMPDSPASLPGDRCVCPKNNQRKNFELEEV